MALIIWFIKAFNCLIGVFFIVYIKWNYVRVLNIIKVLLLLKLLWKIDVYLHNGFNISFSGWLLYDKIISRSYRSNLVFKISHEHKFLTSWFSFHLFNIWGPTNLVLNISSFICVKHWCRYLIYIDVWYVHLVLFGDIVLIQSAASLDLQFLVNERNNVILNTFVLYLTES